MVDKIYIVGPVGGGKSTLARRLAAQYGFTCCELDSIIHEPDPASASGTRRRPEDERDSMLDAVLSQKRWIVEDTGRRCFERVMQLADSVILLEPSAAVRKYRLISRWIKQNLGLEKCAYVPDLEMLSKMFKWMNSYDSGDDGMKARVALYGAKVTTLKTKRDIERYIERHLL